MHEVSQKKKRTLLFSLTKKDFVIEAYRGSGKGGQHRNKVETAIRITHPESGAVAFSEDERSQVQNKHIAFKRLVEKPEFKKWMKFKAAACEAKIYDVEKFIEKQVNESMSNKNIKIEIHTEAGWIPAPEKLEDGDE